METQTIRLARDMLTIDEIKYTPKGGATLKITLETTLEYIPRKMQLTFEYDPSDWDDKINSEGAVYDRRKIQYDEGLQFQDNRDQITADHKKMLEQMNKKRLKAIKDNPSFTVKPMIRKVEDKYSKTTLELRLRKDDANTLREKRSVVTRFGLVLTEREDDDGDDE